MGFGTSASPVIRSVHHHDYSVYSSFPESCPPLCFMCPNFVLFHVSVSLCIFIPLVLFLFPKPHSLYMPNFHYPDMFSLVLICSDPHVCSSVWNRHWLSLKLLIQTSEPLPAPRPKFEDSRCLVAQHISWSLVLTEHIEPWYALSPIPALNIWFVKACHVMTLCVVGVVKSVSVSLDVECVR